MEKDSTMPLATSADIKLHIIYMYSLAPSNGGIQAKAAVC